MMMNKMSLENKVSKLNEWLQNHPETHFAYAQKKQNRDYFVNKLCDMDELGLNVIKI